MFRWVNFSEYSIALVYFLVLFGSGAVGSVYLVKCSRPMCWYHYTLYI